MLVFSRTYSNLIEQTGETRIKQRVFVKLLTLGVIFKCPRGSPSRMSVPALYTMMSGLNSFNAPSTCL